MLQVYIVLCFCLSYAAILLVLVLILYHLLVQGHTRYLVVNQGEEDGLKSKSYYACMDRHSPHHYRILTTLHA